MGNKHVVSLSDNKFKKLIRVGKTLNIYDTSLAAAVLIDIFYEAFCSSQYETHDPDEIVEFLSRDDANSSIESVEIFESEKKKIDDCIPEKYTRWFLCSCFIRGVTPKELFKEMMLSLVYAHDEKMEDFTKWKEKDKTLMEVLE